MQLRLTWLVLVIFAVGIMSIGIVGVVVTLKRKHLKRQQQAPQVPRLTNPQLLKDHRSTLRRKNRQFRKSTAHSTQPLTTKISKPFRKPLRPASIVFGTIFAGNEPVPLAIGWKNVEIGIKGLWIGIGTKGAKWGQNDKLTDFWIGYKGSKIEAAAIGYNCYKGSFPGGNTSLFDKRCQGWVEDS